MSEALAPFGPRNGAAYDRDLSRRDRAARPLRIRGAGSLYAQDAKLFDALLAPLSDDVGTPVMILGTFTFIGAFEPAEAARAQSLSKRHWQTVMHGSPRGRWPVPAHIMRSLERSKRRTSRAFFGAERSGIESRVHPR